jgi:hypothetical protein
MLWIALFLSAVGALLVSTPPIVFFLSNLFLVQWLILTCSISLLGIALCLIKSSRTISFAIAGLFLIEGSIALTLLVRILLREPSLNYLFP